MQCARQKRKSGAASITSKAYRACEYVSRGSTVVCSKKRQIAPPGEFQKRPPAIQQGRDPGLARHGADLDAVDRELALQLLEGRDLLVDLSPRVDRHERQKPLAVLGTEPEDLVHQHPVLDAVGHVRQRTLGRHHLARQQRVRARRTSPG